MMLQRGGKVKSHLLNLLLLASEPVDTEQANHFLQRLASELWLDLFLRLRLWSSFHTDLVLKAVAVDLFYLARELLKVESFRP